MILVNSCFLYLVCVHFVQLRDLSLCGFSWVIKRSSNLSESSSPLLTGTFIEKTFMVFSLLHERPCVSSGDTGRSRTLPYLERWSGSQSYEVHHGREGKWDIAVRCPFGSWINPREISFGGSMEGVLALVTLLLTTRMAQVFSTHYLLGILKNSHLTPLKWCPEIHGLTLSFLVLGAQNSRC